LSVISSAVTQRPLVALTFDDGPNLSVTEGLLEALDEYGAKATFFVRGAALVTQEGDLVAQATALVQRLVDERHEVGNHTQNHLLLSTHDRQTVRAEIESTHTLLGTVVGLPPTLIRPPFGADADRVDAFARMLGYRATVLWSAHGSDWDDRFTAGDIAKTVCDHQRLRPGAIILLHERRRTNEAVRTIIPRLLDRGYEFVTVTGLLDAATETETASVATRVGWTLRRAQGRIVRLRGCPTAGDETRSPPPMSLENSSRSRG
jgi:peptidoglycan/xylan/chitin deacetylase (PgdA/CDA1 family)